MFMTDPLEIEARSMEIIAPHLEGLDLTDDAKKVYSRIIHASGDVEYAPIIKIHPRAIDAIKSAIVGGANIFTDVEMVRAGIRKGFCQIHCQIGFDEVKEFAVHEGITRAMASMRLWGRKLSGQVVVIGNAPTALFEVLRLVREEKIFPAAIIGVPVGFVGAAQSKELLAAQDTIPFVTVSGTKGGSSTGVAAMNAILGLLK